MKKRTAVILILIAVLLIVSVLPVTQKTNITISAAFDNTMLQILHVKNWKNWYPAMKTAYMHDPAVYRIEEDTTQKTHTLIFPGKEYVIHAITPLSYQVREVSSRWVDVFAFTVFPGDRPGRMKIRIEEKSPLLFALLGKNKAGENAIKGLRSYLEDPKAFYGYKIALGGIRDTLMASRVFKIRRKDLFPKIHEAYLNLMQYIKTNNLVKTNHTAISYVPLPGDSLQITVGVPVNKPASPYKGISCLSLPAKGRAVAGNYEGRFSDRQKIYQAVEKYMTDHNLSAAAEFYERYLNDSIPSSDSSTIKIELNYPVY